ncbi:hypothetical protein [Mycoplasma phocimorsus]|uniref:hypothetical protein n=1 Tax=Mycoplasma phocimorsus TaxID=3045839 RepID=UPI0024BF3AAA|nr:hypothetical protein [Mycoplasma phocimorsus]MDJ1648737.1 hypothetical protein [Mycoplasma phocimorsus]
MNYKTKNIVALLKLKKLLDKHKINYSLSKKMLDFIKGNNSVFEEPDYRIVMNYKDYFRLKRIEEKSFFDNTDSLNNYLLPYFKDDESIIFIDLVIPTNSKVIEKNFSLFLNSNFVFIKQYPHLFSKITKVKVKLCKIFNTFITKKFLSLNTLVNKFVVNEFSEYILLNNELEKPFTSTYQNISFLTKTIMFKNVEFKYFFEFE